MDDGRPKYVIHAYPNIGDALFAIGPAIGLARACRDLRIGIRIGHPWFSRLIGPHIAHDPLKPVFGHSIKILADAGWIPVPATPWCVSYGRSVIEEYASRMIERIPIHGQFLRFQDMPCYLGFRPPRDPQFIGVFSNDRPGRRWARGQQLVKILRSNRIPAEEHPRFESCEAAARWISLCTAFVGPDSGLTHLASALGVPVVMVLGARFDPTNFPWPNTRHVTSDVCPRGPCYLWDSRKEQSPYPFCPESPVGEGRCGTLCVDAVKLEDVLSALSETLDDA